MNLNMTSNEEVLKQLPSDAVREALLKIIERKIPSKHYKLQIESGSAKGDNYIGITLRLTVTYKENNHSNESELKKLGIFIKIAPDNPQRRQHFFIRPCFLRETLIYNEFIPLLKEFQQTKGISDEDGFSEYSECYYCITNEMEETIFMEDVSLKGYIMHDRFVEPSADLVKNIMKSLGKFHALSFAVKDQWPEKFSKYTQIDEIFGGNGHGPMFESYMNKLEDLAFDVLSDKSDQNALKRIKNFLKEKPIFQLLNEFVDGSTAEPYAVVCHGDCWNNNILFKYQEGHIVGVKLIDWQLARYSTPVTDLMYYIFSCTTKNLRAEHYDEFLDVYYTELSTFLQRLGSDPAIVFPRSVLDDQLKKFGAFGLIMGLIFIPTISKKKDDVPDLDELSMKMDEGDEEFAAKAFASNLSETRLQIRDMILDLIKLEYI